VGLKAVKWGLKVSLKRLFGGSKVRLNLQSLLQSSIFCGASVQVPGLSGLVQSSYWTPANSDYPAADSVGEGQLSVIAQHSGPEFLTNGMVRVRREKALVSSGR
jgi:hypothetical protein